MDRKFYIINNFINFKRFPLSENENNRKFFLNSKALIILIKRYKTIFIKSLFNLNDILAKL